MWIYFAIKEKIANNMVIKKNLNTTKMNLLILFFTAFSFDLPEDIRNLKVFWCFRGDQIGTLGRKGLIRYQSTKFKLLSSMENPEVDFPSSERDKKFVFYSIYWNQMYIYVNIPQNTNGWVFISISVSFEIPVKDTYFPAVN